MFVHEQTYIFDDLYSGHKLNRKSYVMKFHTKLYKRESRIILCEKINFPFQEFAWRTEMMILSFKIYVNNIQQLPKKIQKLTGNNETKEQKILLWNSNHTNSHVSIN